MPFARSILVGLSLICTNAVVAQVNSQNSLGAFPAIPKIVAGMPYGTARQSISSLGWQPSVFKKTILDDVHRRLQQWFLASGYQEVEDCAPTGDRFELGSF
jgi:hypothetical protein